MAYSNQLVERIEKRVSFIGRVLVYPGENEIEALIHGALRGLRGIEEIKEIKN